MAIVVGSTWRSLARKSVTVVDGAPAPCAVRIKVFVEATTWLIEVEARPVAPAAVLAIAVATVVRRSSSFTDCDAGITATAGLVWLAPSDDWVMPASVPVISC